MASNLTQPQVTAIAVSDNLLRNVGLPLYSVVVEERKDLMTALETFVKKYDESPDGELGVGLTNGDFSTARAAIAKAQGVATAEPAQQKRRPFETCGNWAPIIPPEQKDTQE